MYVCMYVCICMDIYIYIYICIYTYRSVYKTNSNKIKLQLSGFLNNKKHGLGRKSAGQKHEAKIFRNIFETKTTKASPQYPVMQY